MGDHDALLAAVIANPDDDTPRLVMADWFQENGDEDRAEFIRVQCELAALIGIGRNCNSDLEAVLLPCGAVVAVRKADEERVREFAHRERELPISGDKPRWLKWIGVAAELIPDNTPFSGQVLFSRGFVETVTCTADGWLANADALHWHPSQGRPCAPTAQPIRKVNLTTRPQFGVHMAVSDPPTVPPTFSVTVAGEMSEDPDAILKTLRCLFPGVEFELPPEPDERVRDEGIIMLPPGVDMDTARRVLRATEPRTGIRFAAD